MYKYLSTIGMNGIPGKRLNFGRLMKSAFKKPDFCDEEGGARQAYKLLGDGFGVYAGGKAGGKPEEWGVFADGGEPMAIRSHSSLSSHGGINVACDGATDGNRVEFRVVNELKGAQILRTRPDRASVSLSMLTLFGKIILPVHKDPAIYDAWQAREKVREMAKRAIEAFAPELAAESAETEAREVWARLRHEDVFTVIESYIMPIGVHSAVFSVLSEIKDVARLENKYSGVGLWRLSITLNGAQVFAYISDGALTGAPSVGMRFIGTGLLQGKIL